MSPQIEKPRINYTRPSITALEERYAADAAANGWGPQCYDYLHRFEAAFAQHLGVDHAVATSSCTGALHLGMAALGLTRGDEVILADTNWVATVSPIVHLGATPVFVDIDPLTWCIDPEKARQAVTPRTKAIVATHLYGNVCDMRALQEVADDNGLVLIEDAAEAIGSEFLGRKAGSIGEFGAFSFHGTKTMTTGEGGMFVTSNAQLYERVLTLSNHGRSRTSTKQFWAETIGYKYKMSNVQAAIGCAQLERIDELVARKQEILRDYRASLSGLGISMNYAHDGCELGAWMPTAVFAADSQVRRADLLQAFSTENIDARVFFYPLSALSPFDSVHANRHSFDIPERAINLPSYHDMSGGDIARVCEVIKALPG